jgi:thiamine biosynthesis lipoprotein
MRVRSALKQREVGGARTRCAVASVVSACVASCASAPPANVPEAATPALHRFREIVMGVEMLVVVDADSPQQAARAARAAFDAARAVDEALSDWTSASGLKATLDAAAAVPPGTPVPASTTLIDAMERADAMSRLTDGAFDCTAAPVVALWREARAAGEPPDAPAIAAALERVGYRHVHADRSAGSVRLDRRGMSLDFGGIGKGIASSAALAAARKDGCDRTLVAVSGDVAAGSAPRGREGWQVAIESGLGSLEPCVVWLRESALSTSGDAEQVLVHGGQRHSHIVDPRTGQAVNHAIAPTAWSTDPAVADAAATSLSVIGIGGMDSLCERIRSSGIPIEMRVAYRETPDGPVLIRTTSGFPACIGSGEIERHRSPASAPAGALPTPPHAAPMPPSAAPAPSGATGAR